MSFNILDVAVGPMYMIYGLFLFVISALILLVIFFAVKAIKKIKNDVEE